jgi:hypothetical protein
MWHQFHATTGWHTYEVEEWVFSLLKNALPETASRFHEVCCFSGTVIRLHKMNDYILSQLRNAEEAPAYFNMLSNYSGDGSGAKSVVMTSGNEKI